MPFRFPRTLSFIVLLAAALTAVPALAADTTPDSRFPHPDRIRYDSHCLTIDGKDMLIFSGAFHYFRCPRELWHDRLAKIKEAGFNTVETYVAWNVHETQMPAGLDDFSKITNLQDLDDFITMAESLGLYVIIRPGPYICAEWDRGGFPAWLVTKKPDNFNGMWLRSDDPAFLAWSKHWFDAVCPVIAKHQITHKQPGEKGVILFQVENEYDYARFSDDAKINHIRALAQYALADGIDVPIFTCWTRQVRGSTDPVLSKIFDSCNFYPGWKIDSELIPRITELRGQQPNAPQMTTELQGGWFHAALDAPPLKPDADAYRNDLSPAQINNITLLAFAMGDTLTNYYMLFGGTNLGDMAALNIATSYDYSAPIRECGGIGDKYLAVKAIGEFIKEHGPKLARAEPVDCGITTGSSDVSAFDRRTPDGARFIFVRTSQHTQPRSGIIELIENSPAKRLFSFHYQLDPLGSKVLYLPAGETDPTKGTWYPKVQPPIDRPSNLPASVKITDILARGAATPTEWKTLPPGATAETLGIYDRSFVFFRAKLTLTDDDLNSGELALYIDHPASDAVAAELNGQLLSGHNTSHGSAFSTGSNLHAGENQLLLVYENAGNANGGEAMEKHAGITQIKLVPAVVDGAPLTGWRVQLVKPGKPEQLAEIKADADDSKWSQVTLPDIDADGLKPNESAVYRSTLEITDADLSTGHTALSFARIDDSGAIFVNGQRIAVTTDWSQSYLFDAAKQLHTGKNAVAIYVHNADGGGGLAKVTLALADRPGIGNIADLQYADIPMNTDGAIKPGFDALVSVHQLTFELPARDPHLFLPWLIRIHASGNGFLFLNDHPIGRFWQNGKQTDYYMPECWLKFGPGEKNVLELQLRQLDKPVAVESAEAIPYAVYAEHR